MYDQKYYKPKWLNLSVVTKVPLKLRLNSKDSHLKQAMKRATIDRNVLVFRAKCFEIDNLWLFKMRVHISCPQSTAFHSCWCRKNFIFKPKIAVFHTGSTMELFEGNELSLNENYLPVHTVFEYFMKHRTMLFL